MYAEMSLAVSYKNANTDVDFSLDSLPPPQPSDLNSWLQTFCLEMLAHSFWWSIFKLQVSIY